jgi:hypothetical protein
MKAISIRQPWAWLIVNGYKDVENRTWPTNFRGRILIHAGKGMTRDEYEDAQETALDAGIADGVLPAFKQLERGGIVGVATIANCIHPNKRTSPWHMGSQFGFHMVNAQPLPFVPCCGQLGIFDIEEAAAQAIRDQAAKQEFDIPHFLRKGND